MPTLLLVRHGRSTANTAGVLAGRAPGVTLDESGTAQAAALPGRLAALPLSVVVHSPLERCQATVGPLLAARPDVAAYPEERVTECDYGQWTGGALSDLGAEPLMRTVQSYPSGATFPGGESLRAMRDRAVAAVHEWDARVRAEHGPEAVWLMCSHGDVIKAVTADALGLHLDLFQRLHVSPGSVTVIRYTAERPFLLRLGDTGTLDSVAPPPSNTAADAASEEEGRATVGGGA